MQPIHVLLVEDHQIIREGLRRMLELDRDIVVVGEAANGEEALALAASLSPDVVITDIKMPGMDGLEFTRRLRKERPECPVIVLTLYDEYLPKALEAGAVGYLLKDLRQEDLVAAIRAVQEGRSPFHFSVDREHLGEMLPGKGGGLNLTERELSILRLVASGVVTRNIANQLALSDATVKRALRQVFDKMGVRNRSAAVAEALKRSLI